MHASICVASILGRALVRGSPRIASWRSFRTAEPTHAIKLHADERSVGGWVPDNAPMASSTATRFAQVALACTGTWRRALRASTAVVTASSAAPRTASKRTISSSDMRGMRTLCTATGSECMALGCRHADGAGGKKTIGRQTRRASAVRGFLRRVRCRRRQGCGTSRHRLAVHGSVRAACARKTDARRPGQRRLPARSMEANCADGRRRCPYRVLRRAPRAGVCCSQDKSGCRHR